VTARSELGDVLRNLSHSAEASAGFRA
jgi:hypothetical protein